MLVLLVFAVLYKRNKCNCNFLKYLFSLLPLTHYSLFCLNFRSYKYITYNVHVWEETNVYLCKSKFREIACIRALYIIYVKADCKLV